MPPSSFSWWPWVWCSTSCRPFAHIASPSDCVTRWPRRRPPSATESGSRFAGAHLFPVTSFDSQPGIALEKLIGGPQPRLPATHHHHVGIGATRQRKIWRGIALIGERLTQPGIAQAPRRSQRKVAIGQKRSIHPGNVAQGSDAVGRLRGPRSGCAPTAGSLPFRPPHDPRAPTRAARRCALAHRPNAGRRAALGVHRCCRGTRREHGRQ